MDVDLRKRARPAYTQEADGWCKACRPVRQHFCEAASTDHYVCTRDALHEMPHVACGGRYSDAHALKVFTKGKVET